MKLLTSTLLQTALLLSGIHGASANTEKVIFLGPAPVNIPLASPSLADLHLDVFSPDALTLRRNLSRTFPEEAGEVAAGTTSWFLLDDLRPGQRYELRVCWAATQPTAFTLDVHDLDSVWATPELVQSLSSYAYAQQQDVSDQTREPRVHKPSSEEKGEREASVMLLQVRAAAGYFTDDVALMKDPPPVLVDLILDPYLYNVLPVSLLPTIGYLVLVGVVTWFVARSIAKRLQAIASTGESIAKKQN
ncbi:hypothetical protein G7046_g6287 [Stylonectria norvegica]|nr:hypothetical protein G7046_g6287 [Stylonectria norvegica]